jgi:hypothetical protein
MGVVVIISLGLVSLRYASAPLAGVVLLLTLGILCLAILGIVYRRGARQASWLGFALLGWGYFALSSGDRPWVDGFVDKPTLITTMILDRLYSHFQPDPMLGESSSALGRLLDPDHRNRIIQSKLDQPIAMSFPHDTPFEDVLKYIKSATQGPNDSGIPIYVDPDALLRAERTMTTPIMMDLKGVPLRTTLKLMLQQLNMTYTVENGVLTINSMSTGPSPPTIPDSYRRIGHCYWTLLAGWIGGIAARFFYATRDRGSERPER